MSVLWFFLLSEYLPHLRLILKKISCWVLQGYFSTLKSIFSPRWEYCENKWIQHTMYIRTRQINFGCHYVSAKALVIFSKEGFHTICIYKTSLIYRESTVFYCYCSIISNILMLGQQWVPIKYFKRNTELEILLHSSSISLELRCAFAAQMVQ